jgi:hypothetical protein
LITNYTNFTPLERGVEPQKKHKAGDGLSGFLSTFSASLFASPIIIPKIEKFIKRNYSLFIGIAIFCSVHQQKMF